MIGANRGASARPPGRGRDEVVILEAESREGLCRRAGRARQILASAGDVALMDLVFALNGDLRGLPCRLAIVTGSRADLDAKLAHALERLPKPECRRIKDRSGIYFFEEPLAPRGRLAFLFPGEGSQYPDMLRDLCITFPEARECFDRIDRAFEDHPRGYRPSQIIYPAGGGAGAGEERLLKMDGAIEAVFTANAALLAVLTRLGIRPRAMAGHSTGDYSALLASGCIAVSEEHLIPIMQNLNAIHERLARRGGVPEATLLSVGTADSGVIGPILERFRGRLHLAMDNCPHQVILCGTEEALSGALKDLKTGGAICETLPFRRPYHTPLFRPVCDELKAFFDELPMGPPAVDTYSCATAARLPDDVGEIRRLAVEEWALPVRFRETVEAMYADGVRLFVEVGPRGNLSAFVDDILRGRPHVAVPADVRHRSGLTQLAHLLAVLAAHGVPMRLDPLYAGRASRALPLEADARSSPGRKTGGRMILATGWPIVRLSEETAGRLRGRMTGHLSPPAPAAAPAAASPPGAENGAGASSSAALLLSAHMQTMDRFLRVQEEVLRAFLRGEAPATAAIALPSRPREEAKGDGVAAHVHTASAGLQAPAPPPSAGRDRGTVAGILLRLVSDRTGYPVESLDLNLNLEADLGIDSIKRVEILGSLQQQIGAFGQGDMEALSSRKTLRAMIDFLGGEDRPAEPRPAPAAAPAVAASFAGTEISHVPGEERVAVRTISLERDLFLRDHALGRSVSLDDPELGGLPVMPLTMSMEILAEAASHLVTGKRLVRMLNVRAHRWIALDDGRTTLRIEAIKSRSIPGTAVDVQIFEEDTGAAGRAAPAIAGTMVFDDDYPKAPVAEDLRLRSEGPSAWTPERLYRDGMFHGPAFRGVRSIDRSGDDGAVATLEVLPPAGLIEGNDDPAFLCDPVLLDQPGQVVGFWMAEHVETGSVVFPFHLEELRLYGPRPKAPQSLACRARISLVGDRQVRSDLDIVLADGRLLARFIGWEDLRFDLPRSLARLILSPAEAMISSVLEAPAANGEGRAAARACRIDLRDLPDGLFTSHGGLWRRVLAHLTLGRSERETWRALPLPESGRLDWLLERVVLKDAARLHLLSRHGLTVCPADVEVAADPSGRPLLRGAWTGRTGGPLPASVARSGGVVVAAVGEGCGAGIGAEVAFPNIDDVETRERIVSTFTEGAP